MRGKPGHDGFAFKPKKLLLAAGFLSGVTLILCLVPLTALTVRIPHCGDMLVFAAPAGEKSTFTISYLHSVEKAWVQGIFAIGPEEELLLVETLMESVGTGLPTGVERGLRREGKWRVAGGDRMVLPALRFYLQKINKPCLKFNGRLISTKSIADGELVAVKAEKITWAGYLFHILSKGLRMKSVAA
jgi:hypothetical protein